MMLYPITKDEAAGPGYEVYLALIQTVFGENSHAISTLTQLLKTPYGVMFTAQHLLHRPFLGSIRSGIRCAPIPLSKNFARKNSRLPRRSRFRRRRVKTRIARIITNGPINL